MNGIITLAEATCEAFPVYITDSSDSENEEHLCGDVTSDSTSDYASTHGSSTSRSSCSKQLKGFYTDWLREREHWLRYEKDVGMFCLLCQKYNKRPYDRDTWNKTPLLKDKITKHR